MPSRCVAGFCSNTHKDGVSLFKFPKDSELLVKWVKQVRRTRDKWAPSSSSLLCSEHFELDCFDSVPVIKESLGCSVQHKRVLLPGAVPTVFRRAVGQTESSTATLPKTDRNTEQASSPSVIIPTPARTSFPVRSCVQKRQKIKVISDAIAAYDDHVSAQAVEEPTQQSFDASCQVDISHTQTRNVSVGVKPRGKTKGTQTFSEKPLMVSVSTQTTDEILTGCVLEASDSQLISDTDSDCEILNDDPKDLDYVMSDDSDLSMDDSAPVTANDNLQLNQDHRVYFIFWDCLVQLLDTWCSCCSCGSRQVAWTRQEIGTLLKLSIRCVHCGHCNTWNSQPYFGRVAAGNVLLSAGILFAGATATKVLRVLMHMGTAVFSVRTFFRHQQKILHRAVMQLWRERQMWMLSTLQAEDDGIVCGGDGRADTPGHCAKYGTYTMMELRKKAVIDLQTVQSNEVGSSYHMEGEGLARSLQWIQTFVTVDTLITDKHISIKKYLHDQHPNIEHLFDIWHVAKGTKAAVEMEKIVCNPRLLKDISQLSSSHQTSNIEAFHSLLNHFAPKMISFSFKGMECRTALAALHFNENAHRAQSVTKDGAPVYGLHFPKYKNGGYIVRKVLEEATYGYVDDLLQIVRSICQEENEVLDEVAEVLIEEPKRLPLSALCEKPEKDFAVKSQMSRFTSTIC